MTHSNVTFFSKGLGFIANKEWKYMQDKFICFSFAKISVDHRVHELSNAH